MAQYRCSLIFYFIQRRIMNLSTEDNRISPKQIKCAGLVWSALSLFILILTAVRSAGPLHPDEYYQIIEFASYRLGHTQLSQLPYEFNLQIRPWLQPFFAMIPMYLGEWFGLNRADTYSLVRLCFALVMFGGLRFFLHCSANILSPQAMEMSRKYYFLVCFVPFLAVRTASESFCFSLCLFALGFHGLIFQSRNRAGLQKPIWAAHISATFTGLFFGLCFLARAQAVGFFLGYIAWVLFIEKIFWEKGKRQFLVTILLGFISAVCLGVVLDRIGYGTWTLTTFNFFNFNIIAGGASKFGVEPWYFLFLEFANTALLKPLEFIAIAAIASYLLIKRRSLLSCLFMAFLLINTLPAHKESRFIFPLLLFIPLFLFEALQFSWWQNFHKKRWVKFFVAIAVLLNFTALLKRSLEAVRNQVVMAQVLEELPAGEICIESEQETGIFDYTGLTMNFLKSRNDQVLTYATHCNSRPSIVLSTGTNFMKEGLFCRLQYAKPWWHEVVIRMDASAEIYPYLGARNAIQIWSCPK